MLLHLGHWRICPKASSLFTVSLAWQVVQVMEKGIIDASNAVELSLRSDHDKFHRLKSTLKRPETSITSESSLLQVGHYRLFWLKWLGKRIFLFQGIFAGCD